MSYIVSNTPNISTSFTKAYCRKKDCLNLHEKNGLFCRPCLDEVKEINKRRRRQSSEIRAEALPIGTTWIYFIKVEGLEPIKIGKTREIEKRLGGLQTSCPNDIVLLAKFVAFDHVEKLLHDRFKEHWIRGEWFAPVQDILFLIDSINEAKIPSYLEMYPA